MIARSACDMFWLAYILKAGNLLPWWWVCMDCMQQFCMRRQKLTCDQQPCNCQPRAHHGVWWPVHVHGAGVEANAAVVVTGTPATCSQQQFESKYSFR
jgi:hypothetical protein